MGLAPSNNVTNVPFIMVPLHLVDLPANSIGTHLFNIWDYIDYFSDDDSGATDISIVNSHNCGATGL